jgi:hypothetical protein
MRSEGNGLDGIQSNTKKVFMRSILRYLALSLAVAGALGLDLVHADTLKDVMGSRDYSKYRHPVSPEVLLTEKWLEQGANFSKLFLLKEGGPPLLLNWIGDSAAGLASGPVKELHALEYAGIARNYTSLKSKKLTLTILVPHPMFLDSTQAGLVTAFAELEPPLLKVEYVEDFSIHDIPAKMYHHSDGACSLVLHLNKAAIFNLGSPGCDAKDDLLSFANVLDLIRLNEKLAS